MRSLRSPRTSSEPVTTIAPRDGSAGLHPARRDGEHDAACAPASATRLPPTMIARFSGELTLSQKHLPLNGSVSPLLDRPLEERARPVGPAAVDGDVRRAADRLDLQERRRTAAACFLARVPSCVAGGALRCRRRTTSRRRRRRASRSRRRASDEQDDARLEPAGAPFRPHRRAARARVVVVAGDEARVELVDVQLAVEAEVLRVGAQEALDVRLRRELRRTAPPRARAGT